MKQATLEFIATCWGEGIYGNIAPTHVRLNPCHKPYIDKAVKPVMCGWVTDHLVFTEEVNPDYIEIVNVKYLRPVYETTMGYGRDHSKPMMFTFSRKIDTGLEVCPCCGRSKVSLDESASA